MKALNRSVVVESRIFAEGTLWLGIPENLRNLIPGAYFSGANELEKVEDGSGPGVPVGGADGTDLAASTPAAAPAKPQRAKKAKARRR